jgi:hypothetical protein
VNEDESKGKGMLCECLRGISSFTWNLLVRVSMWNLLVARRGCMPQGSRRIVNDITRGTQIIGLHLLLSIA